MWRSVVYRVLQSLCQAVPIGLLVLVIEALRSGTVTAGLVWLYGILAVAALAGQCLFGWLSHTHAWIGGMDFSRELRMRVLDHLRRLPMSHHARQPADTAATFTSDMYAIEIFTESQLPKLAALALPIAIFLRLLVIDPPLAIAAGVSVALSVPVFVLTQRRMHHLARTRQDRLAATTARVIEYVQGIAVIRAFNQHGTAQTRLRGALNDFRAINNKIIYQLVPLFGTFAAIITLGVPIVIAATAYRLFGGSIDAGTAIVVVVLVLAIYRPIVDLFGPTALLHIAIASLDRVAEILDTPAQPQPATTTPLDGYDVRFDHVSFGYESGVTLLDDVTFDAPAHAMTAIVGPSGAGKTTLLSLIARFFDPEAGSVRIGGVDVRELSSDQLFDTVSVVFQDVYLFSGTIYDNIAFGRPDADPDDVTAAATAAHCHEFIAALPDGYQTRVGEGGHTLSGGERQRVSIARAILKDAPIVLLDEATAALDPINDKAIQQALARLTVDKTLLVVAHRLPTIQAADQILVLDEGRIVQRGTHDQLLDQPGLYARFCAQRTKATGWHLARTTAPHERAPQP